MGVIRALRLKLEDWVEENATWNRDFKAKEITQCGKSVGEGRCFVSPSEHNRVVKENERLKKKLRALSKVLKDE